MGYVTCAVHGSRCCWRCDECPKCSGKFKRVGRGDYCPDCTKWLKANGYVWNEYCTDYTKPEAIERQTELNLNPTDIELQRLLEVSEQGLAEYRQLEQAQKREE